MTNAIQRVVKAISDGAVVRPLAVDIALDTADTTVGMMHPTCTQHLPDEGWEFLGRAVLDINRMQRLLTEDDIACDWCGISLLERVSG